MFSKKEKKKKKLKKWNDSDIEKITNNFDLFYSSNLTHKVNGYVKNLKGERLVWFNRKDRGMLDTTTRIIVVSSSLDIFYDKTPNKIEIEFDNSYFGKIENNLLYDAQNKATGRINKNNSLNSNSYSILYEDKKIAEITKNIDNNSFVDLNDKYLSEQKDIKISEIVKLNNTLDRVPYLWVTAITIFEIVYFDFYFKQTGEGYDFD